MSPKRNNIPCYTGPKINDLPTLILLLFVLAAALVICNWPEIFGDLLIIAVIVAIAAAVSVICYVIFWYLRNKVSRVIRVETKVVRRRKKDWDVSLVGDTAEESLARLGMMGRDREAAWEAYKKAKGRGEDPELTLMQGTNYFVTFMVDEKEVELCVSEDYYIKCAEDTTGLLVYRGEEFMYFVPGVDQS